MAGFIRRFGFFPGSELISQIEGAVIVDLPPPGSIQGVGTGTACLIGEFADVTYGVSVAADGTVTTAPDPVEVFSAQDMLEKVGGWDETLGNFGGDMGNGFTEIRNKKFSRLILVPVNMASSKGIRLWRELPTNTAAANANPVVPVQAATVSAGREFKSGSNRARVMKRISFSATEPIQSGIDADTPTAGAAATQTVNFASGNFVNLGVQEGDILVLGVIAGAGYLGSNAGTYRITQVVATSLDIQKLDGTSFALTDESAAAQPWRIHPAADADTGLQHQLSEANGYIIPARPMDATIATATLLTPTVVPPALSADSADALSGLMARTSTNVAGLVYTATIQAPNAANDATIDVLYTTAIDSVMSDDLPEREVNLIWSARKSTTIRTKLKNHVLEASSRALTRTAQISPSLDEVTFATIIGDAAPGVGATRDERDDYSWPGAQTFIPEAVGTLLNGADGINHSDGIVDVTGDGWLAAVLSNLAPERNPGQAGPPVPEVLAPILGFQRGLTGSLNQNHYIQLRSKGVCALRMDRTVGPIFQSGVTSSLIAGQKNINRRRMADFIEDSIAQRLVQFSKLPLTQQLKDGASAEVDNFLNELLSPNNPPAQRINAYEVDTKSGNTPTLEAAGIFVIIIRVRTLATADFIVLQAEIGESVTVTST